ncbi:MAG: Ca-activated chloride channel [Chthoniobacter sp.]|jgi:Ca-activated chloride channel family protein|nr:Ca-activated chloride channel [Chthoniobacter sp.]
MKTPRSSAPTSEFGLLAWLENTRIVLPLKGVECRFEVTGAIACVEVDQIFHQNTDRPLDCTYTFPLPAGAAVYRCELHVNDRVIRAKVEEQEAARRIYRERTAAGRRAALVETERENIFTLSLGNVQPEDVIVVRFAWFQVLDRAGDGLRLLVPTCPGVRYIPGKPLLRALSGRGTVDDTDQVPDASRISPPRIDALHPDAAYFSIEGRLSAADVESGTASSPSHPIFVRESDGAVTVKLCGRGAIPDRDFALAWREPKARQLAPQAWRWVEGNETYALVQLRAPDRVKVADGFAQDVYFLIDRSGSMSGAKWQRTCEALRAFVGLLGAEDRVWITLFESDYRDFAEAPMPAPAVLADRGFQCLEALGTGGGTELLPAAAHVLEQISRHSAGRRASVVLITDGQVGNDALIVRAFQQAPQVRVHTFGIDTMVNDAFLKSLAHQQRGGCWLQTPADDIAGTIAALGDRLRRPVLTDLSVRGSWEAGRATWPDLHVQEVVTVSLRGTAATALEITGRLPDGTAHCFAMDLGTAGSEAVKLLWAKERMAALLAAERPQEAIALARQHNLICQGAAFIAWDEAEQVQIAQEMIVQPVLGWAASKCLAAPCAEALAPLFSPVTHSAQRRADTARFAQAIAFRLREACDLAGASEPTVEALRLWVHRDLGALEMHLVAVRQAAEFIAPLRSQWDAPDLWDLLEHQLHQALSGSTENLLKWIAQTRNALEQLIKLKRQLSAVKMPKNVAAPLVAWVWESGTFDQVRLQKLAAFGELLDQVPFSADEAAHWRTFLDSIVGGESKAYPIVLAWLTKPEARRRPSARASV